jgi:nicotinate-nucleotide adenylyltransferase
MIDESSTANKRERVALYGGAFDPIHNGHLATIAALLASGQVDRVIVIPSGDRPDKVANAAAAERLAMTELAVRESFDGDGRVTVSDMHVAKKVGYGTVDLIDYFKKDVTVEPLVVIGCELLKDLSQWKDVERLKREARFFVIPRPGVKEMEFPQDVTAMRLVTPYEGAVNVSSTTLRSLLAKGLSCAGLMPQSVIAYCKAHGLYGARRVS